MIVFAVENSTGPGRPVVTRQSFDSVLLDWVPASPSLSVHGYSVQYLETGTCFRSWSKLRGRPQLSTLSNVYAEYPFCDPFLTKEYFENVDI